MAQPPACLPDGRHRKERGRIMSADVEREPWHRGSRLVLLLPLAVFGLLGAAFYWGLWNNDDRLPSTLIDKAVPEFALAPIEGRQDGLSSADLQGRSEARRVGKECVSTYSARGWRQNKN